MSRAARATLLALMLAAGACAAPVDPGATPGAPIASLTPAVASTAAVLEARLGEVGMRLQRSPVDYRPGEPAVVQAAPRAVYRVPLAGPDEGRVLIYELGSADAASRAGRAFADYLGTGVGQTNYPRDAQFALSQVGSTLVFTWWSPSRSSDPEQAGIAFDAVRSVGQPIQVVR